MEGLADVRITDLVDIAVVAALLCALIVWLRRTPARFALGGIALLAGLYLLANWLQFQLTAWILQGFSAVAVIIAVVVFQQDLRRLFEQIAVWGLGRGAVAAPPDTMDVLVRAVARMASTRTGALIVIPGSEPLERHLEGGIELGGRLSEPLLLSLFDASSPGHDGAVVIERDRITRFAVHLPLSDDREQLGPGGTRHAAALGLAERSDALCIVVSEERGSVSVASDGRLRVLGGAQELPGVLGEHFRAMTPAEVQRERWRGVIRRWPEALVAVGLALLLWLLRVPGAGVVQVVQEAPVGVENLPNGYALESVEPEQVEVTLSGSRRDLYLRDRNSVRVRIDAVLAELGRRTFRIAPEQVERPPGIEVVDVEPGSVRISLTRAPPPGEPGPAPEAPEAPEVQEATPGAP